MPVTPTYPGVYLEEIPSGVRTITGVATSITAFIGRALRGPVNEPKMINSFGEYERTFGGLWEESAMGYAVRDFYLNGGAQAIIVRLYHPTFANDDLGPAHSAAQAVADAVSAAAKDAVDDPTVAVKEVIQNVKDAASKAVSAYAKGSVKQKAAQFVADAANSAPAGTSRQFVKNAARAKANDQANAQEPRKSAADSVALAAEQAAVPVNAKSEDVAQAAQDESNKIKTEADNASAAANAVATAAAGLDAAAIKAAARAKAEEYNKPETQLEYAVADQVAKAAEKAVDPAAAAQTEAQNVVTECAGKIEAAADVAKAARTEAIKDVIAVQNAAAQAVDLAAPVSNAQIIDGGSLSLEAANPGAWGNGLRARVDYDVSTELVKTNNFFNLTLHDDATGTVEVFRNVTVVTDPRRINKVLENESQLARWAKNGPLTDRPVANADAQQGQDLWSDHTPATSYKVTQEGSDGAPLSEDDFTGGELEGAKQGLYALEKVDLFNLLCIPPYKINDTTGGYDVDVGLIGAAASYCELKRRAMLLIDPPSGWTSVAKAIGEPTADPPTGVSAIGTSSKNAALFFPRLLQPDPKLGGFPDAFAPCGAVAGVFARTDATRGVWKAPAGLEATLVGVPNLSVSLTDMENGELNPLGINCLRNMPGAGRVVWGARTLQGNDRLASEWKYIPVRRTALYIEESLYRGTQWVVFEPNDEPLWAQVRLNVGAFMHNLFRQGAFAGKTPQEAYFVKCDKESTTQNDVNLGIVNIVVGFAPLKPAEFVIIKLQQIAGQLAT
jgi:uncharacterized protein